MVYVYIFGSVMLVSVVSLVGVVLLSLREAFLQKVLSVFIALAAGALLGDAFIHLIPEALAETEHGHEVGLLVIGGIVTFFLIEKYLHWHHHGDDTAASHVAPVGKLAIFSDAIHNFIDGIIIAASFMVSIPVGMATTVAVLLHEVPQEVGDFAVLLHAGYTKAKAVFWNFLSALAAVVGAATFVLLGDTSKELTHIFVPFAAGGLVYIALVDLIPGLHKEEGAGKIWLNTVFLIVGVLSMFLLTFIEVGN
jgi:zinc and cadmium transporter